jgi:hypothetical protein
MKTPNFRSLHYDDVNFDSNVCHIDWCKATGANSVTSSLRPYVCIVCEDWWS